jgi:hypothetical protein
MRNALSCGPEEENLPPLPLPLPLPLLLLLLRLAEPKPMVELLDAVLLTVTSEIDPYPSMDHAWQKLSIHPRMHIRFKLGFRY